VWLLQVHTTDWLAWEEAADVYLQLQVSAAVACCPALLRRCTAAKSP
jgi:hypothetical protein